jgi:hypothetical protein
MAIDIQSRGAFVDTLRDTLLRLAADGVRDWVWSDIDFAHWPLNEGVVIEGLTRWVRPHHRLVLLAQHYDELQRRHPRFVAWRRTWGHVVDPRVPSELLADDHPCLLLAGRTSLELIDRVQWRGRLSEDPADAQRCGERLDAILQRSGAAFAATTLGL